MNEPWETSIYPIINQVLLDDIDEEDVSDEEINIITNKICQKIDKEYIIQKRR